jgi:hypothetical protein
VNTAYKSLESVSSAITELGAVSFSTPAALNVVELALHPRGRELEARVTASDRSVLAEGGGRFPDRAELESLFGHLTKLSYKWDEQLAKRAGQALASGLSKDVVHALEGVPDDTVVTLQLSRETESIPWEWTEVGGQYLFSRFPVARAPVGIADAARGYPQFNPELRILLIGVPQGEMPGVERDVMGIAAAYGKRVSTKCDTLFGSAATFQTVVSHLDGGDYDIVHFTGHAWFDRREGYLMLHEQAVIRANELRSFLGARPPAIIVLNSHFTAFVPPGARDVDIDPGTRALTPRGFAPGPDSGGQPGFTGMTSAVGVGALIGCFGSPGDDMGAEIGLRFHQELIAGQPIALALHRARISAKANDPTDRSALVYTLSGYPELALPSGGG